MLISLLVTVICISLPFITWFLLRGGTSNKILSIYLPEKKHKKMYRRYKLVVFIIGFLFFSCFLCLDDMANHHTMFGYMYESHKWW